MTFLKNTKMTIKYTKPFFPIIVRKMWIYTMKTYHHTPLKTMKGTADCYIHNLELLRRHLSCIQMRLTRFRHHMAISVIDNID